MKGEVKLNLKEAYFVLDVICSYKYLLEVRCETAASQKSKQLLLKRWELVEALRTKILMKVKNAEGQKL